jgi:beta-lactamase regulating signal transducer with metallopeptidase domain
MSAMAWELETIAQMSAAGIVDCLVIGSAIAIFAGLMLKMPRRSDSGTRFAVWFAALMTIAAAPFVGRVSTAAVGAGSHSFGRAVLTLPGTWAVYVLAAWAAIAAWGLVRVGIGLWHLHALRRSCEPVDLGVLDAQVVSTLRKNSQRGVALCVSDEVQVPTAIGLVKPAVVLPRWVMEELSGAELNQILLHELAHLRRFDDWTNLAQKIVKALFFFHPAVWWIERKISLEREMACDDAVLEETENPRAYAECLAHLAEKTFIQRSIALAQAALGKMRQTSLRVAQILNENRDRNREGSTGRGWKLGIPVLAGFAVLCVAGIARAPRLVAFSDGGTSVSPNAARVSFDAGSPIAIPATRVGLRISVGTSQPAVQLHLLSRVKQAPLKMNGPRKASPLLAENESTPPRMEDLMRQAKLSVPTLLATPAFATQSVYVMFEGRGFGVADQSVYEIRVWRLVVFHPVVDPDKKTPHKET